MLAALFIFIQSSINEGFDFVSVNIGLEEVLCALDDIVSDSDIIKEEDYEFLVNELKNNLERLNRL